MIELRSDTFTLPTPQMRAAMSTAPLGDDVYGEDPTVRELEELAADRLGMAAACLMPSGTMANLASLLAHAARGTKILVGDESDLYIYEAGGASVCGGLVYEPVPTGPDGTLAVADLAARLPEDPGDPQFALPSVLCLENTHNRCGGVVLPAGYLGQVRGFADEHGLRIHVDGARVFNAAVAAGVSPAEIVRGADSVQFCLSKGLGAPIGSVVVGDAGFVARVRRARKMLGGGMRQAGVIAAAGILAVETSARLAEDHANARRLAEGLAMVPGIAVDPAAVQTNIVMFRVADDRFTLEAFLTAARDRGVALAELGHGRVRAVTHVDVDAEAVDRAVAAVADVLARGPVRATTGVL